MMIYSNIDNDVKLPNYPKVLVEAISYLKNTNFAAMEDGTYEIKGEDMYAKLFGAETAHISERRPESHEKYIDVQFTVSGSECIGVTNFLDEYEVDERIDEEDLIFYKSVKNEALVEMYPGCFCVLFPDDIHRPLVAKSEPCKVRKVVIKISTALLD